MSTAAEFACTTQDSRTEPCPLFEYAPLGLAQCNRQGNVTALNPALEQLLGGGSWNARSLSFADLIHLQERAEGERLFHELFEQKRDSFHLDSKTTGTNSPVRWTALRVPGANGEPDYAWHWQSMLPMTRRPLSVCGKPRNWKRWDVWQEAWLMTSTIFSPESCCTAICSWQVWSLVTQCASMPKKF
jgi:hypothetical protein